MRLYLHFALGTNEGIKEPIGVNIKTGRTGLGHEKEEESKKKFQAELLLKASLARSKANVHSVLLIFSVTFNFLVVLL